MAAVTQNFLAQKGSGADIRNMLLKVFSGEVIKMYDETVKFLPTVKKRTLPKGAKSLQFPIIGSAVADYYAPGSNIMSENSPNGSAYLQKFKQTERLIHLDRVMLASCFIDKFEESLVHFDARSEYTRQMSIALANARDKQIIATILKGARTAVDLDNLGTDATSTLGNNTNTLIKEYGIDNLNAWDQRRMRGSVIVMDNGTTSGDGPTYATITAANLMDTIYKVAEVFDLKSVPKTGRYLAITPSMFYTLVREQGLGSSVVNRDIGGSGSLNPAPTVEVAGITVMADNFALTGAINATSRSRYYQYIEQSPGLLGATNFATSEGWAGTVEDAANDYRIDKSSAAVGTAETGGAAATTLDFNLMMLAWQSDAVGAVEAMGLSTESQYLIEYQGDLIVVKQAVGQDVLRPECCIAVVRNRQEFTLGYRHSSTTGRFADVDNVHIFLV